MSSRLDVLLPVFNAAKTIEASIQSIQAQEMQDFRIVAVNDGSTDGSRDILHRLAREDARIEVIDQENGGIVDALNRGAAACRAEFIARHDADDLSYPERFTEQLRHLQADPDCVATSGPARHIDSLGRPTNTYAILPPPDTADPQAVPSREPYLMHPFVTMRRAALERIGGYRYAFHSEDTDLYWRLFEVGRLHNADFLLGDYRLHAASISSASVLNGRIAAVSSQLAAISHLRRTEGRPDLAFPKSRLAAYTQAGASEAILELASQDLTAQEARYLRLAFAMKLVELATYRPYKLDRDDLALARTAMGEAGLTDKDRSFGRWLSSKISGKLLRQGDLRGFFDFTPLDGYPKAFARAAFRRPKFMNAKAYRLDRATAAGTASLAAQAGE